MQKLLYNIFLSAIGLLYSLGALAQQDSIPSSTTRDTIQKVDTIPIYIKVIKYVDIDSPPKKYINYGGFISQRLEEYTHHSDHEKYGYRGSIVSSVQYCNKKLVLESGLGISYVTRSVSNDYIHQDITQKDTTVANKNSSNYYIKEINGVPNYHYFDSLTLTKADTNYIDKSFSQVNKDYYVIIPAIIGTKLLEGIWTIDFKAGINTNIHISQGENINYTIDEVPSKTVPITLFSFDALTEISFKYLLTTNSLLNLSLGYSYPISTKTDKSLYRPLTNHSFGISVGYSIFIDYDEK